MFYIICKMSQMKKFLMQKKDLDFLHATHVLFALAKERIIFFFA